MQVDHRYSPPWWQTSVCLPDDPVKVLVGREGQFFLDYGVSGPRNFATMVGLDWPNADWISQSLPDARVPVVVTRKKAGDVAIVETTFQEIPDPSISDPAAVRYDGFEILEGWVDPALPCDPAFRDAAVRYPSGSHEASLEFHLSVPAGAERTLALGVCEGFHTESGKRRMIARAEGASEVEIDPVRDFGPRVPGVVFVKARDVDGDGKIMVSVKYHPDTSFWGGTNPVGDARTLVLSAIWAFEGEVPPASEIVAGKARAAIYAPCAKTKLPHRREHLIVELSNRGDDVAEVTPCLRVQGLHGPQRSNSAAIAIGPDNLLTSDRPFEGIEAVGEAEWRVESAAIVLRPKETRKLYFHLDRFVPIPPETDADDELRRVTEWWTNKRLAPASVTVPDAGIQATIDSCVRNILQARDIRNGLPSYHVGPTIYRGLFLADGAFFLELAAMMGQVDDARAGIEYLSRLEHPEGGFNVIDTYYKENGLAIFAIVRHAQLTNDKDWLRTRWKTVQGCVDRIARLRRETKKDPEAPNYGLLPAGAFCDGGVMNNGRPYADYSNPAWCLSGLRWAVWAATWLGEGGEASAWQGEYDDFMACFRKAAEKDLRDDGHGNRYLPVVQGNGDEHAPPRGQWAFCHSIYPGCIWAQKDPIAQGNVAMLRSALVEGLVFDTGWMHGGLWTYFASFYAHALQWLGMGEEVPQALYDFANHASPTLVWREEQKPQGQGYEEVGDMPHNWASAEFLRMVVHMVQIDRGEELHLLEGFPRQWLSGETRLVGIGTPFGRVTIIVSPSVGGLELDLRFLDDAPRPSKIAVHRKSWSEGEPLEVEPAEHVRVKV